jgi:hypothetical protein
MSELAKRGRLQLVLNLFAFLAISALVGLSQISTGSAPPFVPIGRFGLSLLLAYFVYRGSESARALFVFFAGLAALITAYWFYVALTRVNYLGAFQLSFLVTYYAQAAWAIATSQAIKTFWAERSAAT